MNPQAIARLCREALPDAMRPAWGNLEAGTLANPQPPQVMLLGAFSAGKSSLVNMLLQEDLLPVAQQECTAAPVFIEYGERAMAVVSAERESRPVALEEFQRMTSSGGEDIAFTTLRWPAAWLRELCIVDLPGLGGTSPHRREYTRAQIQAADAILYLLQNRGPSPEDLDQLRTIRLLGKQVKILVSRWDEVEHAVAQGESAPSLEMWAAQIGQATGTAESLTACSRQGAGREAILEFLTATARQAQAIREERFRAEAGPLVSQAIEQLEERLKACEAQTDEAIRRIRGEIVRRKELLIAAKSQLYRSQNAAAAELERAAQASVNEALSEFNARLGALKTAMLAQRDEPAWQAFLAAARRAGEESEAALAGQFQELSAQYGALQLNRLQADSGEVSLNFPAPPAISRDEFLETTRIQSLEQQIAMNLERVAQGAAALPEEVAPGERAQLRAELNQLVAQMREVEHMELPMIPRTIGGQGLGRTVGRVAGELVDLWLIFGNPLGAGAEVANMVGKAAAGAKAASMFGKAAAKAKNGIEKVRRVRQNVHELVTNAPPGGPFRQHMDMLEMLSAGYWGEKLGGLFDAPATTIFEPDLEAQAQQQAALEQLKGEIQKRHREWNRLMDLSAARESTEFIRQESRRKADELQREIDRLKQQADHKAAQAEQEAIEQHAQELSRQADRAMGHWVAQLRRAGDAMGGALRAAYHRYWAEHIEQSLAEHAQALSGLEETLAAQPGERDRLKAEAERHLAALQTALAALGNMAALNGSPAVMD